MGEYMFGSGRGEVKAAARKRIGRIAAKHDADLINVNLPGSGWQYWFACDNLGSPFDTATAKAVKDDLVSAGISDDNGILPEHIVQKKR